jgi:hypothetical protein
MKKVIMTSLLVLVASFSFGQIQVYKVDKTPPTSIGKLKSGLAFVAEMEREVNGMDTTYTLSYQDNKYQHITAIQSLQFNSVDNSFDTFYEICKSVFKEENKKNKDYSVTFKLGQETIVVTNSRTMGTAYVRIFSGNGYSIPLLESQIDKLFGK